METNGIQLVEFLKSKSPYNIGDRAGFPIHAAHILISTGYAKPVTETGKKDVNYRGMPWFKLRAVVKSITDEEPTDKNHALALLQSHGLV